jgi:adenylosuccinate synthase
MVAKDPEREERLMPSEGQHVCVVGVQWGDEGKGKIVDVLTADHDVVVRYQGGANAGHTVKIGDKQFVFHLIPSGILQENKVCVIGNGVVVDPQAMIAELEELRRRGIDHEENLLISDRAHVVLPYHRVLDAVREKNSPQGKIGTTLRGIGPCYTDKASRCGIRMTDLIEPQRFAELLRVNLEAKNRELGQLYGEPPLDFEAIYQEYSGYAQRLRPRVCDISSFLHREERQGARILFEGAQGSLLDVDLGTYPFVTSSNTSFLGLGAGTGFSPRRVGQVLGVTKAYTTRVGEGPLPTELLDDDGKYLRVAGNEYGATTGRPRRCGWLDLPAVCYAIRFGDVDALVVTKLDVLDGLPKIRVAVGYRQGGKSLTEFPPRLEPTPEPIYQELPGWQEPIGSVRRFEDLPEKCRAYLEFIATACHCPIAMVSVGQDREAVIRIDPPLRPGAGGTGAALHA